MNITTGKIITDPTVNVDITTGKIITDPIVNVEESLRIGEQKLQELEAKLPSGFYNPISKL